MREGEISSWQIFKLNSRMAMSETSPTEGDLVEVTLIPFDTKMPS
jgi:hypothetical protein